MEEMKMSTWLSHIQVIQEGVRYHEYRANMFHGIDFFASSEVLYKTTRPLVSPLFSRASSGQNHQTKRH